jgi:hypothetical protein
MKPVSIVTLDGISGCTRKSGWAFRIILEAVGKIFLQHGHKYPSSGTMLRFFISGKTQKDGSIQKFAWTSYNW